MAVLSDQVEVTRLLTLKDSLKGTMARIINYPKKVSYECMMPLSSVAFVPGKILHTNEFKLADFDETTLRTSSDLTNEALYSYYEAYEILKHRLKLVESRLENLQGKCFDGKGNVASKQLQQQQLQVVDAKIKSKALASNGAIESTKVDKANAKSESALASNAVTGSPAQKVSSDRSTSAAATVATTKTSRKLTLRKATLDRDGSLPVMEIREFVSDKGKPSGHELVNLEEAMNMVNDQITKMESRRDATDSDDSDTESSDTLSGGNNPKKSMESLTQLKESLRQMNDPDPETLDEHMRLVRELAEIAASPDTSSQRQSDHNSDAWLDELERLEQLELQEEQAAARIREKERQLMIRQADAKSTTDQGSSSGGWKKGFFGGNSKVSSKTKEVKIEPKSPINLKSQITAPAELATSIAASSELPPMPSSSPVVSTPQQIGHKPVPLRDAVIERNVPPPSPMIATGRRPPAAFTGKVLERNSQPRGNVN